MSPLVFGVWFFFFNYFFNFITFWLSAPVWLFSAISGQTAGGWESAHGSAIKNLPGQAQGPDFSRNGTMRDLKEKGTWFRGAAGACGAEGWVIRGTGCAGPSTLTHLSHCC